MRLRIHHLLAICLVWGCASGPPLAPPVSASSRTPVDEDRLHLELIERMLDGGRGHAALAHLDALKAPLARQPEARLLRAETLRRIGRGAEARELYQDLLDTGTAALAHRGLGLLAADDGDLDEAIDQLERARGLRPTASRIRNDLGFALLLMGEFESAGTELVTALELGGDERAAKNLVLLHLVEGRAEAAERLARSHDLDEPTLARLSRSAEALRERLDEGDGS